MLPQFKKDFLEKIKSRRNDPSFNEIWLRVM